MLKILEDEDIWVSVITWSRHFDRRSATYKSSSSCFPPVILFNLVFET